MAEKIDMLEEIWEKAVKVPGYDENVVRKDACGAWIMRDKYGMMDNVFGWSIDWIYPIVLGGDEDLLNLRPLHCLNIESKGEDYPSYVAAVIAEGDTNVVKERNVTVNAALREKLSELYGIR